MTPSIPHTPGVNPLQYTPAQEGRIRTAMAEGDPPVCPICDASMEAAPVPHVPEVSYVRHRIRVTCTGCGRGVVLDRRHLR